MSSSSSKHLNRGQSPSQKPRLNMTTENYMKQQSNDTNNSSRPTSSNIYNMKATVEDPISENNYTQHSLVGSTSQSSMTAQALKMTSYNLHHASAPLHQPGGVAQVPSTTVTTAGVVSMSSQQNPMNSSSSVSNSVIFSGRSSIQPQPAANYNGKPIDTPKSSTTPCLL